MLDYKKIIHGVFSEIIYVAAFIGALYTINMVIARWKYDRAKQAY